MISLFAKIRFFSFLQACQAVNFAKRLAFHKKSVRQRIFCHKFTRIERRKCRIFSALPITIPSKLRRVATNVCLFVTTRLMYWIMMLRINDKYMHIRH